MAEDKMNDGGAAFPVDTNNQFPTHEGMSLRDYFAAKAMQGLMIGNELISAAIYDDMAGESYRIADAMLKARAVPRG